MNVMGYKIFHTSNKGNLLGIDTIHFDIDNPTTFASYLMLKDYYKKQEKITRLKLIEISREYLTNIQNKYGSIHCTYCNKPDLIVELEGMKVPVKNLATIDHIQATSKGGDFFNPKNFTACCGKCNGKKSNLDILTFLGFNLK